MKMIGELIGLGLGVGGALGKMFGRKKANRELNDLLSKDPTYAMNPIANQRLGLATTLLNARSPGAAQAEKNIYTNQANQISGVQRNATDASQAIAAAAGISGQSNDAFTNLGMAEAQDYQRRYNNLTGAQEGVIREGDKVFNDQVRRYDNLVDIRGAQQQNRQNNWGDVSNLGFSLADFGMAGGFNKMFGGGGSRGQGSPDSQTQRPTSFAQLQGFRKPDPRLANSSYNYFQ